MKRCTNYFAERIASTKKAEKHADVKKIKVILYLLFHLRL